ncbi:dihydroorotase [Weissella diestrammenae]|uniref:Dihydroorotase n=1 Tax=Weissella diestrammenae TaxID=1162633 RepID=A0A7G9T419_9LACO|nr:dihydroorotase [Weissella diestrammenae]MCM0583043.1 dihydroorotase [Weissella diestrammenae]QNN74844.1 dihydroorotase [Weissella diestrammenae]
MTKLLIRQAKLLVSGNECVIRDVLINAGKIDAIAPEITVTVDRTIDAEGALLLPGLIDVHVHFREPGFTHKETILTGSKAAAHGGFTTVAAMPNLNPTPSTVATFKAVQAQNTRDGVVHIEQFATISNGLVSQEVDDLTALADAGAVAFTNDGKGVQTAATMLEAMRLAAAVDKPIVTHLEDESLMQNGVMNLGVRAAELKLPGIDPLAESSQLARDLMLVDATRARYHVAHISTRSAVNLVRLAKRVGLPVTAEVSPHHLLLDETDIPGDNAQYKMNPPLRTPDDRAAVIAGLLDGTIDMVATDHAPHAEAEKNQGFLKSAMGIVGIESSFQLIYTHFVRTGIATLSQVVAWMIENPARAFALSAPTTIAVGQVADLALFDLEKPYVIDSADFLSKGKNTPFIGQTVYGQTQLTVVAGEIVYER